MYLRNVRQRFNSVFVTLIGNLEQILNYHVQSIQYTHLTCPER